MTTELLTILSVYIYIKHRNTHIQKHVYQNSIQSKIFTLLHDHTRATQPNRHTTKISHEPQPHDS